MSKELQAIKLKLDKLDVVAFGKITWSSDKIYKADKVGLDGVKFWAIGETASGRRVRASFRLSITAVAKSRDIYPIIELVCHAKT